MGSRLWQAARVTSCEKQLPLGGGVLKSRSTAPGQWLASMRVTRMPSMKSSVSRGRARMQLGFTRMSLRSRLLVTWLQYIMPAEKPLLRPAQASTDGDDFAMRGKHNQKQVIAGGKACALTS